MKSFLCKGKRPIIKWSFLPDNTFFEGQVPEGYSLAVVPSGKYIVVDVDRHCDEKNGFNHLPHEIERELFQTLNYRTKNNGRHFWLKYSGEEPLGNKLSGLGIDLRVGFKGYVIWYCDTDIRDRLDEIQPTSSNMNKWLVKLFGKTYLKK